MSTKKSSKESFVNALELLEKEKGIPKAYMIEKIEAALVSAYHKEYGSGANVRIVFDLEKDDVKVFQQKTVVEEVVDPENEITLADAKAISRRYTLGQLIEIKVKPENFRRLSAAAAKSVIIQSIREGERKVMQDAYENQREEIITATVNKIDLQTGNVVLDTGTGRAVLLKSEQIPGEEFAVDDRVKVFVMEVNKEAHGPLVTLSRSHAGLVRRLFELEVPEIADGVVMIKSVSREAGVRSKVAVYSRDPDVDPVGACIGNRGMRIASIVDELRGEKVDIVNYSESIEEFVANALAPARVISVEMTGERSCRVQVEPDQLSLAIGREGLNARLAARLTGCKIDIKAD
ncbi:MAG: transcription termination/antitermination protein NusA [Ruminococcaceae bacterium]|nr:transcription termination/antitermination protein NusA [Oscillospiraceae bacterium]